MWVYVCVHVCVVVVGGGAVLYILRLPLLLGGSG
jgi:hypothetical protein